MLLKIDEIDEVSAFGNRILQLFLTASISAGAKSLEDVSLGRGSWLDVGPSRPIELNPSFPAPALGFDPFSTPALSNSFAPPAAPAPSPQVLASPSFAPHPPFPRPRSLQQIGRNFVMGRITPTNFSWIEWAARTLVRLLSGPTRLQSLAAENAW